MTKAEIKMMLLLSASVSRVHESVQLLWVYYLKYQIDAKIQAFEIGEKIFLLG